MAKPICWHLMDLQGWPTDEFSKAEHEIAQNFGDVVGVRAWL